MSTIQHTHRRDPEEISNNVHMFSIQMSDDGPKLQLK